MWNKILIVDDDAIFRSEFKKCFDDWNIIEAANGDEALSILNKPNEISLVILDVNMPGINGIEALRKIKEFSPQIGIIIITGYGTEEIAIKALRFKADNYIKKPFDIEQTKAIIEKVIEKLQNGESENSGDISEKIERVKSFLQNNCCKKIHLSAAAKLVCLSPKYLSRVFKENTGMGYNEYRLKMKMDKAKELLKDTGFNVEQIARKLSYENPESFMSLFKKITGLTPSEFRKQLLPKTTLKYC